MSFLTRAPRLGAAVVKAPEFGAGGNHTHGHRSEGRFLGRRVNCEQVPLLPARVVAWMLDDPRKIPYLLIWKSRSDGTVKEAARIAPYCEAAGRVGLIGLGSSRSSATMERGISFARFCARSRAEGKGPVSDLPLLQHPASRAVRMGARWTVHQQRPAFNVGVP